MGGLSREGKRWVREGGSTRREVKMELGVWGGREVGVGVVELGGWEGGELGGWGGGEVGR